MGTLKWTLSLVLSPVTGNKGQGALRGSWLSSELCWACLKESVEQQPKGGASGGTWDAPDAAGQGGSALRSAESEATASTAGLVATAARDMRGLNSLSGDSVLHPHPPSPSPQVTSSDPAFFLHRDAHPLSSVFEVWKSFILCGDLVLT